MVRERSAGKQHMDRDGKYGSTGRVHAGILQKLYLHCIQQNTNNKNNKNYFAATPPKSLDSHDLQLIPELDMLSLADACATLEAFTADSMVRSLDWLPPDAAAPQLWILAGGGWFNPVIYREFATRLQIRTGKPARILSADQAGWSTRFMEAQLFAWLAVRHLKNLPLSVPGTTGVAKPTCGGELYNPA